MGYWDKKEDKPIKKPAKKGGFWKDEEPEVKESPENGDNIDFNALDDFEKESQDSSRVILEEVEGIAESIKKQKTQAKDTLSSNYWFAVCFNNETQKRQFLENAGFDPSWTFIQGDEFSRAVGVGYKEPNHDYSKERRVNPNFKARAREIRG